jgi:hypothetical protein
VARLRVPRVDALDGRRPLHARIVTARVEARNNLTPTAARLPAPC